MEWKDLADAIFAIAAHTEVEPPKQLPGPRAELIQFLIHHEKRVDEICEHWALTNQWPLMLPVEWWLVQFRLWHGWNLAMRLSRKNAHGDVLPVWERRIALRWLLADSWLRHDTEELAGEDNSGAPALRRIEPPRPPTFPG